MTTTESTLTFAERKAAEAAFHGLPPDPTWPPHALAIYLGIIAQTKGRNLCEDEAYESAHA